MSVPASNKTPIRPESVDAVIKHVDSLRFGVVQIVIHEGRVVQVDKTEKFRLDGNTSVPIAGAASVNPISTKS